MNIEYWRLKIYGFARAAQALGPRVALSFQFKLFGILNLIIGIYLEFEYWYLEFNEVISGYFNTVQSKSARKINFYVFRFVCSCNSCNKFNPSSGVIREISASFNFSITGLCSVLRNRSSWTGPWAGFSCTMPRQADSPPAYSPLFNIK